MAFLDIAVIAIILISALIAFSTGLVRMILGLLGWVGAGFATLFGFRYVQPIARTWISPDILADIAAGLGIFIVSMVVLTFINHRIGNSIRNSSLSALDRTLGLVFGLVVGVFVVSVAYFGVVAAANIPAERDKQPEWIKESKTWPLVVRGARIVRDLAPQSIREKLPAPKIAETPSQEKFEKLVTPETGDIKRKPKEGYSADERREMERLIKGQQ